MKYLLTGLMIALMTIAGAAHQAPSGWEYDPDCCGGNDCEPVEIKTDSGGNFAVLKNGKKWYIHNPRSVRPSRDDNYHVCIHRNQVWCLYVPTGI